MDLVAMVVAPIVKEIELREIAISVVHDLLSRPAPEEASLKRWSWAHEALVTLEVEMAELRRRYEIVMVTHRRATRALAVNRRQRRNSGKAKRR